ncbi:protein bric-a-brac 2 isoform X2 [Nilaparvata lugens]|uniref:protein bric-a-brac 2 isoform X2 n=1 Tax=Nilaparvata lugens TaxID=108931 RepID=UPI00193E55E0|nr:protein bric-a-brac 2 isoform X2 [Nilaparvata lugens]
MAAQQFCLRWNNHQPNFISVFSNLLSSESLVDVTLAAEGKHVQAHKVVLSACSSYFQSLFTVNPCQHPIVILKDIKYSDLKTMIDFMYCGEVNVSQEQLPAILKTAETLKVKGLAEMGPDQNMLCVASDNKDALPLSTHSSPSMLRRKRLRKSSTGSGSGSTEQTTVGSEDQGGGGGCSAVASSPLTVKAEGLSENESSLRHEPSTDSEHGLPSQDSVDDMSEATNSQVTGNQTGGHHTAPQNQSSTSSDDKSDITLGRSSSTEDNSSPSVTSQSHFTTGGGWELHPSPHYPAPPAAAPPLAPPKARAPHRRRINPQQSEAFREALEAVRTGRLGFCKAAKTYGVNNRTLWLEYKRLGYPLARQGPKHNNAANANANSTNSSSNVSSSGQSPPADRYTPNHATPLMPTSYFDPGYPFTLSSLQPVTDFNASSSSPASSSHHNRGGGANHNHHHHLHQLTSAPPHRGGGGGPGGPPPPQGGSQFEYFDSQ